jgi:hypothetical protein
VPSPPTLPGARSVGILDVPARFARLDRAEEPADYNFAHFRTKHLVQDAEGTLVRRGIAPGEIAPDWELPRAGGGTLRLSDLRGKPVLLHFGSYS